MTPFTSVETSGGHSIYGKVRPASADEPVLMAIPRFLRVGY
jgi:hypothetical protein